jgi:carboxyl-terminal processing protease
MSGLILQFAYNYTDQNRARLNKMDDVHEMERYLKGQNTLEQFVVFADKNGLKRRNLMIQKSKKLLERFINSRIIYNILNEQAWTEFLNQDDPAIIETLRLFREGKAFPQPAPVSVSDGPVAHAFDYLGSHQRTAHIAYA